MAMIWRGFYFYRRRMDRRRVLRALAFLLMALALTVLFIAATQMRPLLESMATTRVSNTVTRIVSEAVYEAIEKGELQYDGLVSFEKDTEGHITAVQSNMAAFNHLQAEILDTVLTRISQVPTGDLSIPIGSLTGSTLLAGRGPRITVRMESVGSSEANFRNAFTSAGINQTKHQIIPDGGCLRQRSAAGVPHRHQGVQFLHRGGDGDRGHGAGHLHLFLHRSGYVRGGSERLHSEQQLRREHTLWTTARK